MTNTRGSTDSLAKATKSVAEFSGHKSSLGAAGYRESSDDPENCEFLHDPGQSIAISPKQEEFETIFIGVEWDSRRVEKPRRLFDKIFKKVKRIKKVGVDLDIGCLYELQDGTRGSIQAFGEKFGALDEMPFIVLSGDERTGDAKGYDEYLLIKGENWSKIKRLLVYLYIYDGAPSWSDIKPRVVIDVPGENDLYVTLKSHNDSLEICAVAELENIRNGIKLTNRTEYFPGHEEMDRAFGFGLDWEDGVKP